MNKSELHVCHTALILALRYINLSAYKLASAEAAFTCMASCGNFDTCPFKCTENGFAAARFYYRFVSAVNNRDTVFLRLILSLFARRKDFKADVFLFLVQLGKL